jgi:hypothetical protein
VRSVDISSFIRRHQVEVPGTPGMRLVPLATLDRPRRDVLLSVHPARTLAIGSSNEQPGLGREQEGKGWWVAEKVGLRRVGAKGCRLAHERSGIALGLRNRPFKQMRGTISRLRASLRYNGFWRSFLRSATWEWP